MARLYGVEDAPEVEVVREIIPSEMSDVVVPCLEEQGFHAWAEPNGGVGVEIHSSQDEAYNLAHYICLAKYPPYPVFYQPMSERTLRAIYDWHMEETLPCLAAEGTVLDDVPTFERFRDLYLLEGTEWFPLQEAPDSTRCEDVPPEVFMESVE